MSFYSSRLSSSYIKDDLCTKARKIPFFGKDTNVLTYLVWEKEINQMHPVLIRQSELESYSTIVLSRECESRILSLYLSRLEKHALEWWDERQYWVHKGRKSTIEENWYELRACMRRKFVPPLIIRNLKLMRDSIQEGKSFLKSLKKIKVFFGEK